MPISLEPRFVLFLRSVRSGSNAANRIGKTQPSHREDRAALQKRERWDASVTKLPISRAHPRGKERAGLGGYAYPRRRRSASPIVLTTSLKNEKVALRSLGSHLLEEGQHFTPIFGSHFTGMMDGPTPPMMVWLVWETLLGSLFQLTNKAVPYFSTDNLIFLSISFRSFSCLILVLIWLPLSVFPLLLLSFRNKHFA